MKKKRPSRIGNFLKKIFRFRSWVDFDRMKVFTLYLFNGFKKMFVPQRAERGESFREAMVKLRITESDLQAKQQALYRLSILMCTLAFVIFIYCIYQLIAGTFRAVIISLVVGCIALTLAFRYHFWYFQIKKRKLGCSITEWYRQGFLGEKE